jgi:2',3'-cyclic-nucleotide 2'-phosphodiesterase (5'-nucleotidase family)
MKITCRLLAILLICFPSFSLAQGQPKTVTILHTNDMHSAFLPHEAGWIRSEPKPLVGGLEELWWQVDSLRRARGDALVLDAGDVMTGTPISDVMYNGAFGGALFEMMNLIGYDAWTIGNHDLDISQANLIALTQIARFPTLSANLLDTIGRHPLNNRDYVILVRDGLRIGIIGLMSKDLFELTNTKTLKGLVVAPTVQTMQRVIDKIDPETDVIVALTHQGTDEDSILAESTRGLDVIIGAHSHTRLTKPRVVNRVIICQTGANCESLGDLEITVDNDEVVQHRGVLHQLWKKPRPDSEMFALVSEFEHTIKREFGEVLGTAAADLRRSRRTESALGRFVTETMRLGSGTNIAVTNTSGIRKDLSAGPISKLDLYELAPFRNYLSSFRMSGKEVRQLAQRYISQLLEGSTSIQISGLECTWRRADGRGDIVGLKIGGKEVTDDQTYTCGTSDYVVNQAERYLGMIPATIEQSETTVFDALVARLRQDGSVPAEFVPGFREIN